ncbi:hypothetical protein BCR34DRAFT_326796 [Clohesyomyces aquaticus]|uniref:Uncharacterized protein n=1 Tax=Clohesyomyces aquaticus TaxID=1231657 RepID=A0A1Y1ZMI7_9PLEO|nr:hypothetical protein BCR34DRAFT_326796 [Clohesyomyces aquaticus]
MMKRIGRFGVDLCVLLGEGGVGTEDVSSEGVPLECRGDCPRKMAGTAASRSPRAVCASCERVDPQARGAYHRRHQAALYRHRQRQRQVFDAAQVLRIGNPWLAVFRTSSAPAQCARASWLYLGSPPTAAAQGAHCFITSTADAFRREREPSICPAPGRGVWDPTRAAVCAVARTPGNNEFLKGANRVSRSWPSRKKHNQPLRAAFGASHAPAKNGDEWEKATDSSAIHSR